MYRWIPYAFVRIAILYCTGVVLAISTGAHLDTGISIIAGLIATMGFVVCVSFRLARSVMAAAFAAIALVAAGIVNVLITNESGDPQHLMQFNGKVTAFEAVVAEPAHERPRTVKYGITIQRVFADGRWRRLGSRALLYVKKDSSGSIFRYGDRFVVRGEPRRIPAPLNPGEFDLQQYNANRQIYFQATIGSDNVTLLTHEPTNRLLRAAFNARQWAEGIIAMHIEGVRARAIASAFVLGVTDGLDNELMDAYASTGAMHVLSVSGLHVGIVYWLLMLIFKPFERRRARWPLLVVSLTVLWSYAFITGICASVLRAVVMFSFASIARAWNYRMNIYNILAATVCVLLIIDPFMITSVGFQLSFVAVLGIVAIQPRLYQLWEPTSWLWDEIWKLISVSIAAQVATLPLCLFYFHQFPNYFLLTNLFIVPGSFLVLIMGIMLLAVSAADVVAGFIGGLLEMVIDSLNYLIFLVEKLPASVIENIFISPFQVAILGGLIVMSWVCIEHRSRRTLALMFILATSFSIFSWLDTIRSTSPTLTVYATNTTAVDMSADQVTSHWGSPALSNADRRLLPNRIALKAADAVVNITPKAIRPGCEIYVWQGMNIVRIYGELAGITKGFSADLVIFSNNAVIDLKKFSDAISARYYVIDGSNSSRTTRDLIKQSATLAIPVHSVLQQGAFQLKL